MGFKFVRFRGYKLNPENFGGREPHYEEVYELFTNKRILLEKFDYVAIRIKGVIIPSNRSFEEAIWLSKETYKYAYNLLAPKNVFYEAHEGASFDVAKGAWRVLGKPEPIGCPPGYRDCVRVETKLSSKLKIDPFIIEKSFVFKGISGEHIDRGVIKGHEYLIVAYDREKNEFLSFDELQKTLLYRNYLSLKKIRDILEKKVSKHLRKAWWCIERMRSEALSQYKVAWRDVAKEFIPAIIDDGAIPDHNVHYIAVKNFDEASYLLAVLLAPQINAVVRELSPWIGHVQPRFIRYFKIPKYNPRNKIHMELVKIGKEIHNKRSLTSSQISEIENLVEQL